MRLQVKALRMGYVNHKRIREGQIFLLASNSLAKKEEVKEVKKEMQFVKLGGQEYLVPTWCELIDEKAEAKQSKKAEPAQSVKQPINEDEVI